MPHFRAKLQANFIFYFSKLKDAVHKGFILKFLAAIFYLWRCCGDIDLQTLACASLSNALRIHKTTNENNIAIMSLALFFQGFLQIINIKPIHENFNHIASQRGLITLSIMY